MEEYLPHKAVLYQHNLVKAMTEYLSKAVVLMKLFLKYRVIRAYFALDAVIFIEYY
jgi:hypothetical protein